MAKNLIPDMIEDDIPLVELCNNSIELKITVRQINLVQLMTFYSLGRWIVEVQQNGNNRAKYGQQVIKKLSTALTEQFGKGFSEDTLKNARKFYLTYKNRISETVFSLFAVEKVRRCLAFLKKTLHLLFLGRIIRF